MNDTARAALLQRTSRSESKRTEFREQLLTAVTPLLTDFRVCIYTTGSYGRQEAWLRDDGRSGSDIDLFILDCADEDEPLLTQLATIKLQARLVETAESMSFPDFDGDGRFLAVHRLQDVAAEIGSDTEDAKNYFTARLLMLLESQPLFGEQLYTEAIEAFVLRYFHDYDAHADDFRPAFLMNDIERFWRTLCLNYEHRRSRPSGKEDVLKHRLKDMKLGFSRLLTCLSGRIDLASAYRQRGTVQPEDAIAMIGRTPTERILSIQDVHSELATEAAMAMEQYVWFLNSLGRDRAAAFDLLDDPDRRTEAQERQKDFHLALLTIFTQLVKDTELERFALA